MLKLHTIKTLTSSPSSYSVLVDKVLSNVTCKTANLENCGCKGLAPWWGELQSVCLNDRLIYSRQSVKMAE